MSDDIYRQLAHKLDSMPPGYPARQNGEELDVLRALYDPHEALLASVMRPTPESASTIAARAGVDADEAFERLYAMGRKCLIGVQLLGDETLFELMPWYVGVIEGQLPRLDRELVRLLDACSAAPLAEEAREAPREHTPMTRIVPVGETVAHDASVLAHERAEELLAAAKSWGVRDCICRTHRKLSGEGCDAPMEVCLTFSDRENAFADSDIDQAITLDEALGILRLAEEAGLVHTVGNYRGQHEFICNCCSCCCGFLRFAATADHPDAVMRADFQAVVDEEACVGCGTCVERCPTGALSLPDDIAVVDGVRCIGCGLCASTCPSEALSLQRRPEELPPVVDSRAAWIAKAAEERGVPLDRDTDLPWAPFIQPPAR